MFCKYCGAAMTAGENQCRRCGKAAPALSDCGGFYELTGKARPGTPPPPVHQAPPQPARPASAPVAVAAKPQKNNQSLITVVLLVLMAVTLLSNLITSCSVRSLKSDVEKLEDQISSLHETTQPAPEPEKPDPVEPGPNSNKPTPKPLSQQAVSLVLELTEGGIRCDNQIFILDTDETGRILFRETDEDQPFLTVWTVKDEDNGTVAFCFLPSEELLGERNAAGGNLSGQWEYLDPVENTWTKLEESVPGVLNENVWRFPLLTWEDLPEELWLMDQVQLRLTTKRPSLEGGNMTLILEGITLTGPVVPDESE